MHIWKMEYYLEALHQFAQATGGRLNWLFIGFSYLGTNGIAMIILGLFLLFFKRSRKTGVCILLAITFGAFMGICRNYLVVHYPSDISRGILSGGLAALLAYWCVTKFLANVKQKSA